MAEAARHLYKVPLDPRLDSLLQIRRGIYYRKGVILSAQNKNLDDASESLLIVSFQQLVLN